MDKENKVWSCLGMVVSLIALTIVAVFVNGWALKTVWNWFMPTIFGLVSLTMWQAIGVASVFQLFLSQKGKSEDKDLSKKSYGEVFTESLVIAIGSPLISVAFAWIAFQFAF